VFVGCPSDSGKDDDDDDGTDPIDPDNPVVLEHVIVWELAKDENIQALTLGKLDLGTGRSEKEKQIKPLIRAGENDGHLTVDAVAGPGDQAVALQVKTGVDWGAGLDLLHSEFGFKVGDKVTVTGTYTAKGTGGARPGVFRLKVPLQGDKTLGEATASDTGDFEFEATITADNLKDILAGEGGEPTRSMPGIRIAAHGAGADVTIYNIIIEGERPAEVITLATPVITLNQATGVISWTAIENAVSYNLTISAGEESDDIPVASNATSYNVKNFLDDLEAPDGDYDFTLTAIGQGAKLLNSAASNKVTYTYTTPDEYVPDFTLESGELTLNNPVLIKFGNWGIANITIDPENTVTIEADSQANFAFVYPEATGFDIDEWDFATLYLSTTGTITSGQWGYKFYSASGPGADVVAGRTGTLVSDDVADIKLEIRKVAGGFGFQKHTAGTGGDEIVIELTKVVFSKGTRYDITLDPAGGDVTPTSTYLVAGTTVANHLPAATQAGKTFLGWAFSTQLTKWATSDATVDATYNNVTLVAQWINAKTIAPIAVDVSTATHLGTGAFNASDSTATSYKFEAGGYGSAGIVKLTLTLGTDEVLANLDKVTFKITGTGGGADGATYKDVFLLAGANLLANAGSSYATNNLGTVNVGSMSSTPVTITIDKAKANTIAGNVIEVAIYVNAPATSVYTIEDLTFSQN